MTVKELKEAIENLEAKDYDKVEIVTKLKRDCNEYCVEYSPIDRIAKVAIGIGVYVVGIIAKS